jgi:hypothetical protein
VATGCGGVKKKQDAGAGAGTGAEDKASTDKDTKRRDGAAPALAGGSLDVVVDVSDLATAKVAAKYTVLTSAGVATLKDAVNGEPGSGKVVVGFEGAADASLELKPDANASKAESPAVFAGEKALSADDKGAGFVAQLAVSVAKESNVHAHALPVEDAKLPLMFAYVVNKKIEAGAAPKRDDLAGIPTIAVSKANPGVTETLVWTMPQGDLAKIEAKAGCAVDLLKDGKVVATVPASPNQDGKLDFGASKDFFAKDGKALAAGTYAARLACIREATGEEKGLKNDAKKTKVSYRGLVTTPIQGQVEIKE